MTTRRHLLAQFCASAAAVAAPQVASAAQKQSLIDPLRLAVDDALADSGLAGALQRAFGRDTGVAVQVLRGTATAVLKALERGEHDAALTNAPSAEEPLDKQGLVYDRQPIVRSEFVLVGPLLLAKPLAASHDIALAASRLAQAQVPFLSRADGSGTHLMELSMWSAARTAPSGPWYRQAEAGTAAVIQAREQQACMLVERGAWLAQAGGKGFGVLCEGDPRLAVDVHLMRSFRAQHPAMKLFFRWVTSAKGKRLAAAHRGYRPLPR